MTCGIYSLNFTGTDKIYIGQSVNIETRFISHTSALKHSKSASKLQDAFNTYGLPECKILLECTKEELDENENAAIIIFNSCIDGLNTLDTAGASPKYNACGEDHVSSKHSNAQIEEIFKLIIYSNKTLRWISDTTGISYPIVRSISCGNRHEWLKVKYPEEYEVMLSKVGKRNLLDTNSYGNSKYSREDIYKAFALLVDNKLKRRAIAELCNIPYKVVSNIATGAYPWLQKTYPDMYATMLSYKQKYTMN